MANPQPYTPFGTTDIVYGGSGSGGNTPGIRSNFIGISNRVLVQHVNPSYRAAHPDTLIYAAIESGEFAPSQEKSYGVYQ